MDRTAKICEGLDVARGVGLEFGPLASPIVRRSDGRVLYADHATREELQKKYTGHGWDVSTIVDVDILLTNASLHDGLAGQKLDYVIASHVFEHIPDPVGWLHEIAVELKPRGVLSLIIPDKRFCFDVQREVSNTGQLLEAHWERRRQPSAAQVFDFWAKYTAADSGELWNQKGVLKPMRLSGTLKNAREKARAAMSAGAGYADVHCWVFTPASFLRVFADLLELRELNLKLTGFFDTAHGDIEFIAKMTPEVFTGDERGRECEQLRARAAALEAAAIPTSTAEEPPLRHVVLDAIYGRVRKLIPGAAIAAIKSRVVSRR